MRSIVISSMVLFPRFRLVSRGCAPWGTGESCPSEVDEDIAKAVQGLADLDDPWRLERGRQEVGECLEV